MSKPVADKLGDAAAPAFDEFQGGSIQQALIDEWNALSQILRFQQTFVDQESGWEAQWDAATATLEAARASQNAEERTVGIECDPHAFSRAWSSSFSWNIDEDTAVSSPTISIDDNGDVSANGEVYGDRGPFSWGPMTAQLDRCRGAEIQLPVGSSQTAAGVKQQANVSAQAVAWLSSQLGTASQLASALVSAHAKIGALRVEGNKAARMADLDLALEVAGNAKTSFSSFRRFHAYDMWRARALIENTRRLAATARRAIEARFVVNLSKMQSDEPFVKSPALWADEVYDFDLDAPSAVGLSTVPGAGPDALFPNKLADYVNNLENFVQGYSVARPTAVSQSDTEILSLTGPDVRETITVPGSIPGDAPTSIDVLSHDARGWTFHCPDQDSWAPHPGAGEAPIVSEIADACGEEGHPPDKARVSIHLDAWGRINGREASPPFELRHNVRWQRLAVNLVGTGIRDCTRAADPEACYQESFIRFDLRHDGPSWVTNFEEQWRALGVPVARVESGKAIAAEEWLDPLNNSWSQPFVSAAARTELVEQPMGGEYTLELELTPDVRLERIERVQLLAETNYWVRQQ